MCVCARAVKWASSLHTTYICMNLMSTRAYNDNFALGRLTLIICYTFWCARRTNGKSFGIFHWRKHSWTYHKCIYLDVVDMAWHRLENTYDEWTETQNQTIDVSTQTILWSISRHSRSGRKRTHVPLPKINPNPNESSCARFRFWKLINLIWRHSSISDRWWRCRHRAIEWSVQRSSQCSDACVCVLQSTITSFVLYNAWCNGENLICNNLVSIHHGS